MEKKRNSIIIILSTILLIGLIILLIVNKVNKDKEEKYDFKETTFEEIKEKINNKEDFVIVLTQSTCIHCVEYKPIVKEVVKEYKLDNIYYLDYDKEENVDEILEYFNYDGATPTTLFFKNGEEESIMNRIAGSTTESSLIKTFKKLGYIKSE